MNRLAGERSPYLLQHAANPVDWYPWGEEAFERAREENKPIFLSIGYSTCHWCHVMEHESFENATIAAVLNADFVSIKVDREERPDVDRVYMAFVQATTGSGGWPMTVFLTPELKPFFGGTYFPPSSRWGRPGFVDLLERAGARVEGRSGARRSGGGGAVRPAAARDERRRTRSRRPGSPPRTRSTLRSSSTRWRSIADAAASATRRSFRVRPSCCSCCASTPRTRKAAAQAPLLMAAETLRAMALGGMRDHIGGGFHRYSVDAEWRVPHFEKMLYDQAQLVLAYLEAAQATGDAFYAAVAEDTLEYVLRDMTGPGGGVLFGRGRRQHSAGAGGSETAHKRKARSTSGATRRSQTLARRRRSHRHGAGSGSSRTATRRTIRRGSSPAGTCSTRRRRSKRSAIRSGRPPKR